MRTERVTFLTTPENKAALDSYASGAGKSVGHVLREASTRYLAGGQSEADSYDEALALVLPELEISLAKWNRQLDAMNESIDRACAAIDRALAGDPA
ncbi:MAG: hypothetical protein V4522_15500 [Pseudomonadota bacterium]|jgi:hypothetical protein